MGRDRSTRPVQRRSPPSADPFLLKLAMRVRYDRHYRFGPSLPVNLQHWTPLIASTAALVQRTGSDLNAATDALAIGERDEAGAGWAQRTGPNYSCCFKAGPLRNPGL